MLQPVHQLEHRRYRIVASHKAIFQACRHDPDGLALLLFSGRSRGKERHAVAQRREPVGEVVDFALGKNEKWILTMHQYFRCRLHRCQVRAFAINGEEPEPRKQPPPQAGVAGEKLVHRHRAHRPAESVGQVQHHKTVGAIGMIGREQHTVASTEQWAQMLDPLDVDPLDSVLASQHVAPKAARRPHPQAAHLRRQELIR